MMVSKALREACAATDVNPHTAQMRLVKGWSWEDAINTPARKMVVGIEPDQLAHFHGLQTPEGERSDHARWLVACGITDNEGAIVLADAAD